HGGSGWRGLPLRHRCEGDARRPESDRAARTDPTAGCLCRGDRQRHQALSPGASVHIGAASRSRTAGPAQGRLSTATRDVRRASPFTAALCVALALALAFLTLPVLAIFVNTGPGQLISSLGDPQAREALRLSLETSTIAVVVI